MEGITEHAILAEQFKWLTLMMTKRENDVNWELHLCMEIRDGHFCFIHIRYCMK